MRLRLRIGATVTAFADMLGVRRATASDWEHGKKGVSPMGQKLLDDLVERLDTGSNPGLDPVVIRGSTRDPEVKSPNDK